MLQFNKPSHKATYSSAVAVLCLATLMSAIDTGIVTIGLSTIEKVFHADFASVQWVVLSYLLAVTSLIVGIGRIGDIFGKKKLFIFGIGLFTVTSLLCGMSRSIYELILFRAFQGIGGAILISLSFAIVGDLVPREKMMNSMAALTATLPIGFALGPSLGGLLISSFGWRSIFFVNVPIGVIAFLLSMRFPPIPISEKTRKFDLIGMILLAVTLTAYILSVTLAENQGLSRTVALLIAATVLGLAIFIIVEKKTKIPLVHLDMFKDAVFSASLVISIILYAILNGYGVILPFYLQQARGVSTFIAGLLMMTGPVGCAVFTPIAGIAANRFGNAKVMTCGILIMGIGVFVMSTFGLSTGTVTFAVTMFLTNGSLAFFQTPNNTFIMTLARPEQRGLTSGLLNLSRTVGQTTGTAVMGVFYFFLHSHSVITASPESIVGGIRNTLLIAALVMAFDFLLALIAYRPGKRVNDEELQKNDSEHY